jgi:RNA polymerase sigma-70 factor, ECF subfamily
MRSQAARSTSVSGKRPRHPARTKSLVSPHQDRIVFKSGAPGGVSLKALAVAAEVPGLEFFAFDASYVERLRSGDAHVEGHFVSYFSELIRLKLRSRLTSREAIEDVRQETFMRVLVLLRGEGGLRQPDRLGPFVNSVCNHVLLEHYRSKKRVEASIDDETEATIAGREPNALSILEAKDTERVVRKILNELTERDRRLLQFVLLEERDKDEVCAEFGISREYLRVLLHRAKQSFKSFYISRLGEN